MKTKDHFRPAPSFKAFNMTTSLSRVRSGSMVFTLAACFLVSGLLAEAGTNTRRKIREYGFAGKYSGIVRGNEGFRTLPTAIFTDTSVSRLTSEKVPQPEEVTVVSPFVSGTPYSLFSTVSVSKRRLKIRGLYFGEAFNPAFGINTVRSGRKILEVKRKARSESISAMSLRDVMNENASPGGALHAYWNLTGDLKK